MCARSGQRAGDPDVIVEEAEDAVQVNMVLHSQSRLELPAATVSPVSAPGARRDARLVNDAVVADGGADVLEVLEDQLHLLLVNCTARDPRVRPPHEAGAPGAPNAQCVARANFAASSSRRVLEPVVPMARLRSTSAMGLENAERIYRMGLGGFLSHTAPLTQLEQRVVHLRAGAHALKATKDSRHRAVAPEPVPTEDARQVQVQLLPL